MQPQHDGLGCSASMWSRFKLTAERAKQLVHPAAESVVGKHGFTTGSFVVINQIYRAAFETLKQNGNLASGLLRADQGCVRHFSSLPLSPRWFSIDDDSVLGAPAHLNYMIDSMLTIYNEMRLHPSDRSGPPLASSNRKQASSRAPAGTGRESAAEVTEDDVISKVLRRCQHKDVITVKDMCACSRALRSNHREICRLFDYAQPAVLVSLTSSE